MYTIIQRPNNRTYIIGDETLSSKALAINYISNHQDIIEEQIRSQYLNGDTITKSDEGQEEVFVETANDLFSID